MTTDQWLQLAQILSVVLLWLFYTGRWVGTHDRSRPYTAKPQEDIIPVCQSIFDATAADLKRHATEDRRTRDRLHSLEHFQSACETRLQYIEREIDHLRNEDSRPTKH